MSVDVSNNLARQGVQILWEDLAGNDTSYIRLTNPEGVIIANITSTTTDTFYPLEIEKYPQTCIQHSYLDVCGNLSIPTPSICSILLTGVSDTDGSIMLSWSDYSGWKDGVQGFIVEKYTIDGDLLESIPVGLTYSYLDEIKGSTDQIVTYFILATPVDNQFAEIRSNAVNVARRAQLHYPNAFTPDGDGLNDVFKPEHLFIKEYSLNIFNRWGELIFSSDDIDTGWDGLVNGEAALEGNYSYLSKAEDYRGLKLSRSGILLLLRK